MTFIRANTLFTNTFVGLNAGQGTTGNFNTMIGKDAGLSTTTGDSNTFIGDSAGKANTINSNNTFVGTDAGQASIGSLNTFVGTSAGFDNTSGSQNTFLGAQAGQSNTLAGNNTFVGYFAGATNLIGINNTFVGSLAGQNSTGGSNTFVGFDAGDANISGGSNTFIGRSAGASFTTGSSNVCLGNSAGGTETTSSNRMYIANSATTIPLIGGIFSPAGEPFGVTINKVVAPTSRLDLNGSFARPLLASAGSPTLDITHYYVTIDASGGNRTVNLPTAVGITGRSYQIKKIDVSANTVTIDAAGTETIDGALTKVLDTQYQNITVTSDGANWLTFSNFLGNPSGTGFILGQLKPNVTRYAMPGWNVTRGDVNTTLTIGVIYYIPFYYSTTTTATEIAVDVTGAVGGSTIDLRVFVWNDGVPGALFSSLGTISSASTGVKTIAISVIFPQGLYFMAMRASATVTVRANNFSFPIAGPVGAMTDSNSPAASDFCDFFITTKTALYADPAPAPDGMQGGFPFFLLREN